ncbi:MAG TPA: pyridoxamine 5'-phosphate oxidase family protein [Thermoanaerobaculia bacterium]|nr:pyridoxamine 5'-phosphate oxidase family protein [Thermoanaerobaculia bacterium]
MPYRASRPRIPEVYGVPRDEKNLLPWSHVVERMTGSQRYWLSTVDAQARPHTRPVDGLWIEDALYFGGSEESRWRRNLAANPSVCVNLEDGEQAVILHGQVEVHASGAEESGRLAAASNEKYGYGQSRKDYEGKELLLLRPRVVLAWTLLYRDATRFERVDG